MRKTYFIKTLSFVLSIVFVCSAMVVPAFALSDSDNVLRKNSKGEADDSLGAYLAANTYAEYIAPYADQEYPGCVVTEVPLASGEGVDVIEGLDEWRNYSDNDKDYREGAVFLSKDGEARWTITIPTTGRYYIAFSYYAPKNGTVNSIQRRLFIDGEIPFAEARFLNLSKNWTYNYEPDNSEDGSGFVSDLNGNHITPDVTQAPVWRTYYCSDAEGYRNDYYQFYLEAGEHTIELGAEREDCIMDKIIIEPAGKVGVVSAPTYQEYLDLYAGVPNGSGTVRIETEKPQFVSDSAVYMTSDRSSVVTSPSSPSAQLFNVIGANSYNSIGQWAAYTFTVSEEGMYHFVMRYKQTGLEGMYVCRTIKLSSIDLSTGEREYGLPDGTPTVPFAEAYNTRLNYEDDWQVSVLGDVVNDGNGDVARDFLFHFKPGVEYTLYLEVGLGTLAEQLQRVSNSLDNINAYYLRILQLTGASPDPNRDYHFAEIMPDVVYGLAYEGVQLDSIKKEFERLCGGNTGEHLSTLELVSNLLATMGTDEYEIPAKLSSLKSYLGTLGTWLNQSRNSSVTVDYLDVCFVENKDNLPDPDGNFFQRAWFEITSFFHSFFTEYDQMGITNEADMSDEALDVWLASGRDQSKIWRSMIDSDFSDYCKTESEYCQANGIGNIPVALKLITGGTLLPSILADKGPDVYMGLDSTTTINYAIRGAADPIYGFDADGNQVGFADAMDYLNENFDEAALNTIELLGKYYGVPMTMNFAMMYCRMDILLELDVTPPETWDDLLALLPMLQANNLSAGLGATEGLNTTLEIMMYQAGASMWRYDIDDPELPADITPEEYNRVYAPYAGAKIGLDTTISLKVFENYCRMYTDYSFTTKYDGANRFRTGEMPLMLGDYVDLYNQLVVFATEIAGLWEFCTVPGTKTDNGINYDSMATSTNLEMPHSNRSETTRAYAWEYIKWNTEEEAQSEYGNRMVALIGPSAKYATANVNAIDNLSWTTKEANAISEQMKHLSSIKNFPGSYIIARYINFAFLEAYNQGTDPGDALLKYISAINTELYRKRQEFHDSGLKVLGTGEEPIVD